jgi:chemotaxis protein MotB
MSGGGRGRRRRGHEEEHENHERWLVTYADMLTVLMALFIVMFALSVVDKQKFQKFAEGMNGDLGNGASLLEGGPGLQQAGNTTIDLQSAITALNEKQSRQQAATQERDDLERARQKILQALVAKHMQDKVRFELDERGLVVTVVTDDVLFALGSATLRPEGNAVLDAIAPALTALPNQVTVEGHTDDLPISGRFASNWELSAERATSVLRYLLDTHRVPAKRLAAAGYADQRPLTPNISGAARSANRRVEVIVLATPLDELPVAARPAQPITPITAVPDPVPGIAGAGPAATDTPATDTHATDTHDTDTHATGTDATDTDEEH